MVEKAQVIKKPTRIVSQKTLDSKKFKVSVKGEKVQCEFCKSKVFDMILHLQKCHRNPDNTPKIELDWDYIEDFQATEEFLIKHPCTDKEREFNSILAPQGNPFEKFTQEMLDYTLSLPKAHKDAMINAKLNEIIANGIEVRLLNKEEYFDRLKEKVRKGQLLFLLDPLKPITIEEIEANKDILWETPNL